MSKMTNQSSSDQLGDEKKDETTHQLPASNMSTSSQLQQPMPNGSQHVAIEMPSPTSTAAMEASDRGAQRRRESLLRFKAIGRQVILKLVDRSKMTHALTVRHSMLARGMLEMMRAHLKQDDEKEKANNGDANGSQTYSTKSIQIAAILVKNSQNGVYDSNWFVRSVGWLSLYRLYSHPAFQLLRVSMIIAFMALSFFEQPIWCRTADRSQIYFNSYQNYANINATYPIRTGITANGWPSMNPVTPESNPEPPSMDVMPPCGSKDIYLNSRIMPMPILSSLIIELFLLFGLLWTEVLLKLKFLGARSEMKRDKSLSFMSFFFIVSIIDVCISFGTINTQVFRISPLLRPILFLAILPSVRSRTLDLLKGLPAIFEILGLLALLYFLYAWVGIILFNPANSAEGAFWFEDYQEALWNLQVQLTTANFPDFMLPAYRHSRIWMLLFVSLFVFGTYFLMPLILANIFNGYSKHHHESIRLFNERKMKGLHDAFLLLDLEKTGEIKFEIIMYLLFEMLGIDSSQLKKKAAPTAAVTSTSKPHSPSLKPDLHTPPPSNHLAPINEFPPPPPYEEKETIAPLPSASPPAAATTTKDDNTATFTVAPPSPPKMTGLDEKHASHMTAKLLRMGGEASHQHPPEDMDPSFHPAWSRAKMYFDALDHNRGGTIDQTEFGELCTILTLNLHTLAPPLLPSDWRIWHDPRFHRFSEFIQRRWYWNLILFSVVTINCIITLIETIQFRPDPLQTGAGIAYQYHCQTVVNAASLIDNARLLNILQLLCVSIYFLDVCFKILVVGWNIYQRKPSYVFELVFTCFSVVSELLLFLPYLACSENVYSLVLVLRVLRSVRLLSHITRFQLILATYLKLLPRFAVIVGMLIAVYYFFTHLGVMIFGGKLYLGNPALIDLNYDVNNYYTITFNDFGSGISTLFILMVLSSWHNIVEGFVVCTSRWSRIFFLSFYYICVLMVLNLCIAFILDTFITEWTRASEANRDRVSKKKSERKERRRQAKRDRQAANAANHKRGDSDDNNPNSPLPNGGIHRRGTSMLFGLQAQNAKNQKLAQLQQGGASEKGSLSRKRTLIGMERSSARADTPTSPPISPQSRQPASEPNSSDSKRPGLDRCNTAPISSRRLELEMTRTPSPLPVLTLPPTTSDQIAAPVPVTRYAPSLEKIASCSAEESMSSPLPSPSMANDGVSSLDSAADTNFTINLSPQIVSTPIHKSLTGSPTRSPSRSRSRSRGRSRTPTAKNRIIAPTDGSTEPPLPELELSSFPTMASRTELEPDLSRYPSISHTNQMNSSLLRLHSLYDSNSILGLTAFPQSSPTSVQPSIGVSRVSSLTTGGDSTSASASVLTSRLGALPVSLPVSVPLASTLSRSRIRVRIHSPTSAC